MVNSAKVSVGFLASHIAIGDLLSCRLCDCKNYSLYLNIQDKLTQ